MRNKLTQTSLLTGMVLGLAVLAGCSANADTKVSATVAVVRPPYGPPPAPVETVSIRPGPGYAWAGGYYDYYGGRYYWRHGHWARPPRPGQHYYPPYYYRGRDGYMWIQGSWR